MPHITISNDSRMALLINVNSVSPWLTVQRHSTEAHLRLFCFPYAGGGASIFSGWSKALPSSVEVCTVQLPGRENRLGEIPLTHMPDLVEQLSVALGPWLDKPFALFGHSLGALIAFEWLRCLPPRYQPVHFFLSACPAPETPRPAPLHSLPDGEFIDALQNRYQQIPQAILQDPEMMGLFLPVLRADFTLYETYTYVAGMPLACPVCAFGGLQDHLSNRAQLTAWHPYTSSVFTQRMFPGGHFFLKTAQTPLLQAIVQTLNLAENL